MKFRSNRCALWITCAACAAGAASAAGQIPYSRILEPQALRLQVTDAYTGVRIDGEHEETSYQDSDRKATYDRLFMAPVFGLTAYGSIYHPHLLNFTITGEISPGYSIEETKYNTSTDRKEFRFLGNYQANFTFLDNKPYRTTVLLNQAYSYRDYDFFNRVEVDTRRYGLTTGYQKGPVPFTISAWRRYEQTYGETDDSSLTETGLTFDARNTRASGESTFNYTYTDYDRFDFGTHGGGTEQSVGIGDAENFGATKEMTLNTTAGYSHRGYTDNPTDDITAASNFSIEHSPTLSSFYDINFDREMSDSSIGNTDTSNLNGGASLRHQLYESLTSTLRLQGLEYTSSGSFKDDNGLTEHSETETTRFGGSISEQYTKRLGSIGRLSMMGSVLLEHTIQDNGGNTLFQTDESHTFSDHATDASDTFFLSLPFVDESTIVITDNKHTEPAYQAGLDYTVLHNGSLTMIRRTPTSTIPMNSTVLVSYRAQASPSGEYDTLTSFLNCRVDLWNGLLAVYGRWNNISSNAAPELLIQDMEVFAVGAESSWRWLRAGLEYETNDSTFSSYRTARIFQSLAFKPDETSTLNFDLSEGQTHYIDANRTEQNYLFMTRYRKALSRNLGANLDAGFSVRRGEGVDETLATARPELQFKMGKLDVHAGYSFEYGKFLDSDERQKHLLFISGRRNF